MIDLSSQVKIGVFDEKIKSIHIEDTAMIKDLFLQFNDGMNIICGMNGTGKTTILEHISGSFSCILFTKSFIVRNLPVEIRKYIIETNNFDVLRECLSILDNGIRFYEVKPDTCDILLKINQREIYFEDWSSGYKTCFYLLIEIIKEIEFRSKKSEIFVKDFDGLILIDEIDLHLHPAMQINIIKMLKTLCPKAQIIVTTHSPHIIQSVAQNEVIPLSFDETGNVAIKKIAVSEYEFRKWTIDEILINIMGM